MKYVCNDILVHLGVKNMYRNQNVFRTGSRGEGLSTIFSIFYITYASFASHMHACVLTPCSIKYIYPCLCQYLERPGDSQLHGPDESTIAGHIGYTHVSRMPAMQHV